ncbi:hypothetical protein BDA99DRAFT_540737 [Phascolomyces articulosus]|uniref:Uncharacterized protein n=1 Tax=Phascolomyces articulosus TaxID=60185 RepID=A0AAD5JTW0_9FUNG|nr:hypothetical protein BDA99DRAFT_540737 [Phascolomyces articulosus]
MSKNIRTANPNAIASAEVLRSRQIASPHINRERRAISLAAYRQQQQQQQLLGQLVAPTIPPPPQHFQWPLFSQQQQQQHSHQPQPEKIVQDVFMLDADGDVFMQDAEGDMFMKDAFKVDMEVGEIMMDEEEEVWEWLYMEEKTENPKKANDENTIRIFSKFKAQNEPKLVMKYGLFITINIYKLQQLASQYYYRMYFTPLVTEFEYDDISTTQMTS